MKTKIAENIKFYRKQMGLTQEELAEKLCGKKSLISNYENGYSTPDIYTLCRLAEIFDVTLDELVEWTRDRTPRAIYKSPAAFIIEFSRQYAKRGE